jgi:RNA polymerase sigma-70 factor (ECF subfamily)
VGRTVYLAAPWRQASSGDVERLELLSLVRDAQAGQLEAQSSLVRRYKKRIAGFVRPFMPQTLDLEDVVQLVFIKMARRITHLRDPRTFESWLFTLARNTAIDTIRRQRCKPQTVNNDWLLLEAPVSDSSTVISEVMEVLEQALAGLGQLDREIVRLIVEGDSYQAVARKKSLTLGAVKLRLNRARKILRAQVGAATGLRIPCASE